MTTLYAQNGWPVLEQGSALLHRWQIPARNGAIELLLRNGSAGFLLSDLALFYAEEVQPLKGKTLDDWGWTPVRDVRGGSTDISNHCAGCAEDLNALAHERGQTRTFTPRQVGRIQHRLEVRYHGAIRWGQDYQHSPIDGMHFEIVQTLSYCEHLARRLMGTPRGRRVLEANPGQRKVILS